MLILSRNVGEQVIIGDNLVVIEIIDIRIQQGRPKVKLGFKAEKNVSIDRKEIFEAKLRSKQKEQLVSSPSQSRVDPETIFGK